MRFVPVGCARIWAGQTRSGMSVKELIHLSGSRSMHRSPLRANICAIESRFRGNSLGDRLTCVGFPAKIRLILNCSPGMRRQQDSSEGSGAKRGAFTLIELLV